MLMFAGNRSFHRYHVYKLSSTNCFWPSLLHAPVSAGGKTVPVLLPPPHAGSVAAADMLLAFAAVAAWWFPSGGTMIAALGCVLSIFGLYSNYRIAAAGTLSLHLGLFILCYGRSIS